MPSKPVTKRAESSTEQTLFCHTHAVGFLGIFPSDLGFASEVQMRSRSGSDHSVAFVWG